MRKLLLFAAFACLWGLVNTNVHSQELELLPINNLSDEYGPSDEQDIINMGDTMYLVWNQWGDLMFRRSLNGGQNWGEKQTLYTAFDYGASYPVLANEDNHVYAAYFRGTSGNNEIFMVRSDDYGASFGNEIQVSESIHLAQTPQIAATGDTVVVLYEDRDENWDYNIYFTYSTDNGNTWSDAVNISNTTNNARWCNLALHNGDIYAVWNQENGPNYDDLDLYFSKSTDWGTSWSIPYNITNNQAYNARLNTRVMDSSVYVIVSSKLDDLQSDIVLYRSSDLGETWEAGQNLSDNSGSSSRPDLWLARNSFNSHRLYAVWSDETYSGNDRSYIKYSLDNGVTWSDMTQLSQNTEDASWTQIIGQDKASVDEMYAVWFRPLEGTFDYQVFGRGIISTVSNEATITGTVSDPNGGPLENATVSVGGYTTFTNADGNYSLDVPAGTYEVSATAPGHQPSQPEQVELPSGETVVFDITLFPIIPGNHPPHNFEVAREGLNDVMLSWEAPIGFNSQELAYDDGTAEGFYWVGSATGMEHMAVAFEYEESAYYIRQLKIYTKAEVPENMMVQVLGDNGGVPDTSYTIAGPFAVNVAEAIEEPEWLIVEMDAPMTVGSRFYIDVYWPEGTSYKIGVDEANPDGFSYSTDDGGESWLTHSDMDFMMRAGIATDEAASVLLQPQADVLGYRIYRNNEMIEETENEVFSYLDEDISMGEIIDYGITAVYEGGESPQATKSIEIPEPVLFPPVNLQSEPLPDWEVQLDWEAPGTNGEYIHWDSGENSDAVGGENVDIFDAAARFAAGDLQEYDSLYLTHMDIFIADTNCQVLARVWQGGNQYYAGDLIREKEITNLQADSWQTLTFDIPVMIDATQELWIGYRVLNPEGAYPAGTDNGPAVPFKGDMILYGSDWVSMSNYFGWDINWNIQGYVVSTESPQGKHHVQPLVNNPITKNQNTPDHKDLGRTVFSPQVDYTHFIVYRNDEKLDSVPAGTLNYLDVQPEVYNQYLVTTAFDEFESNPSNMTEEVFEGLEETDLEVGLKLYPNPFKNKLKLEVNLKEATNLVIRLQTLSGIPVRTKNIGLLNKGLHSLSFDKLKNLPNGVYILRIETNKRQVIRNIVKM